MIVFSNAKLNIGLNVVEKRNDGFHNIETVFAPVDFNDIIEVKKSDKFEIVNTGIIVNEKTENNLCTKAYKLIKQKYNIAPVKIHLHKKIPFGSGLGGGSSNASFVLKALDNLFELKINDRELNRIALQIGSDCPFFIKNKLSFATGKGEVLESLDIDLSSYFISIVIPNIHVNTALAYNGVNPKKSQNSLKNSIFQSIESWKETIINDFEKNVFNYHPPIKEIKEKLYSNGALYVSMSGSGSAVYGIFKEDIDLKNKFKEHHYWNGKFL